MRAVPWTQADHRIAFHMFFRQGGIRGHDEYYAR
jgi:hypothetical protein